MTGIICLQGGGEFGADCRAMDKQVLEAARRGKQGPVVVVALAPAPGYEHDTTITEATEYYGSLGVADVVGAPDARDEPAAARELVASAGLVVLPGGSPRRLLEGLTDAGLDEVLGAHLADGGSISGASAGAMVLCESTFLPGGGVELAAGLGFVPNALVLPHYSGDQRWLDSVRGELDPRTVVLGLAECSGLIVSGAEASADDDFQVLAVGAAPTTLLGGRDEVLPVGRSLSLRR